MAKKKNNREPKRASRNEGPFNSALESGLRALCVLYEAFPQSFDTQRLVFFDYLVVHSGDVSDQFRNVTSCPR
ncbi:MAG: ABC-three component system middle component 2 [Planctomycetaceae bacterium]